jgi:excisionase family DNA binding protein
MSAARKIQPRGLHRDEAAQYIGVGLTKFDQMVSDGRMPAPRRIDTRKVWDREALDMAFDALPSEEPGNPCDRLLHGQG